VLYSELLERDARISSIVDSNIIGFVMGANSGPDTRSEPGLSRYVDIHEKICLGSAKMDNGAEAGCLARRDDQALAELKNVWNGATA